MKKLLQLITAVALLGWVTPSVMAQCTNSSPYGSGAINSTGTVTTLSTCSFGGEYSTVSGAVAGQTLVFTMSGSNFITIHSGSPAGPVLGSGASPLTIANTFTGTLYAHWNTNSVCGSDASCHTTTVQCTSCSAPPSPCNNTSSFGSASINTTGAVVTISTVSYAGEYSTISGAVSGQSLRFTSSGSGDIITVRSGTPGGPVLAFGPSPLTFANTFTGTVYAHWNTPGCGSQASSRTTTVQCMNCTAPPGPCNNTSAFGIGAIDPNGGSVIIASCQFAGEYATATGAVAGQTLVFSSTVSTDQITVRSGTPGGPVLGFGPTPLTIANTFTGTVYVHVNTSGCGSQASCRNTSVQCTSCTPAPAPANDLCTGAITLPCGGTVTGNTSTATDDSGFPACTGTGNNFRGVWYKIIPSTNSTLTLATCGSSFDTYLRLFDGNCGAQTCLTNNDDFCGLQSQLTANVVGGNVYYVLVSGFGSSSFGAFTLSATCQPIVSCFDYSFTAPFTNTSTTCGAGDNSTLRTGEDEVYKVTIPTTGCWTISLCGSAQVWDSYLYLTSACPGPGGTPGGGTIIGSADDNCPGVGSRHGTISDVNLTAGIYYVTVEPFSSGTCNPYTLSVQPGVGPTTAGTITAGTGACNGIGCGSSGNTFSVPFVSGVTFTWTVVGGTITAGQGTSSITVTWGSGPGTVSVVASNACGASPASSLAVTCQAPPANDLCANAETIACGDVKFGSTCFSTNVGETALPTSCGGFTSVGTRGGNWYRLAGDGRTYTAFTCNPATTFDTRLHVFSGSCGAFTCVDNNDDVGGCAQIFRSSVTFATVCGTDYYILVDGFSSAVGNYGLTLNCVCPTITVSGAVTHEVSCFGGNDGSYSASATGTCGIVYTLNTGASNTTGQFGGLSAGSYTVTASSAGGACSSSRNFDITQPAAPLSGSISVPPTDACGNHISCNGGCVALTSSVTGGTAPYSYAWDEGATTADNACAHAGDRTLTVTDANGCTLSLTVHLDEAAPLHANLTSPADACGYNVTACCVVPSGSGSGSENNHGSHARMAGNGDSDELARRGGGRGSHTHGSHGSGNLVDPCQSCGHNGAINSAASGGCAPYTYAWSNGSTADSLTCLTPGLYVVTITDANGCQAIESIVLTQASPLAVTLTGTNLTGNNTNDGTITATVTGGCGPFTYYWKKGSAGSGGSLGFGGSGSRAFPNSPILTGLKKGKYSVWVVDGYGCAVSATIEIFKPRPNPHKTDDGGAGDASVTHAMTLNAFPNPTKGLLDVQVSCQECGSTTVDLKLTDALGQVVLVTKMDLNDGIGAMKIDISSLAAGMYTVNVNDLVQRVIKQ